MSRSVGFAVLAGFLLVVFGLAVGASRQPTVAERWSDPQTWGGTLPARGATVHVALGRTILLDAAPPPLGQLIIDGRLVIADQNLRLEAGAIAVQGSLQAGSAAGRFEHRLRIVLDGASARAGTLSIANGGRVELYGANSTAWLHLNATADAGARDLTLDGAPQWHAGDRIAIAPSGYDPREAEERRIVSVRGTSVVVDRPLRYRHWGTVTAGVDERAEVGLLSHVVSVESEPRAAARGAGGEVLVLRGGTLQARGVEFEGLGERGRLGHYPIHFHLAGDARDSFVEGSSIVHSQNRCVAIHGSTGVVVRNDVAFDTIGHCYFLEDGIESGNSFEGDLGMLTRAAAPRQAILPSDLKPATFWITNPANTVRGDVAAGSDGTGFWYNLSPHPTGPSANRTIWPRRTPLLAFADDVAHSNEYNGLFVDIERNPPGVTEAPNYNPPVIADFTAFTSYKNRRRGAWLRGTKLRITDAVIADNSIGVTFAGSDAILRDSLVVGESGNDTGPPKPFEANFPIRGFEFYDGRVGVERTRFVNFTSNGRRRASALGTLQYSPFFTDPTNYASALTFKNAQRVFFGKHPGDKDALGADGYRATVFRDLDGSVTAKPGASVVLDTPLLADDDCERHAAWNALVCDAEFASLFIIGVDTGKHAPGPVRVASTRRPAYLTLYGNAQSSKDAMFQTNIREGRRYVVTFARGFPAHLRIGLHARSQRNAVTLVFPQAPVDIVLRNDREPLRAVSYRRQGGALVVVMSAGPVDVMTTRPSITKRAA